MRNIPIKHYSFRNFPPPNKSGGKSALSTALNIPIKHYSSAIPRRQIKVAANRHYRQCGISRLNIFLCNFPPPNKSGGKSALSTARNIPIKQYPFRNFPPPNKVGETRVRRAYTPYEPNLMTSPARGAMPRAFFCLFSRSGIHFSRIISLRFSAAIGAHHRIRVRFHQLFETLSAFFAFVL